MSKSVKTVICNCTECVDMVSASKILLFMAIQIGREKREAIEYTRAMKMWKQNPMSHLSQSHTSFTEPD